MAKNAQPDHSRPNSASAVELDESLPLQPDTDKTPDEECLSEGPEELLAKLNIIVNTFQDIKDGMMNNVEETITTLAVEFCRLRRKLKTLEAEDAQRRAYEMWVHQREEALIYEIEEMMRVWAKVVQWLDETFSGPDSSENVPLIS
ncbi:hypothetical protein N7495_003045 [Penicillium taxi]|uniref:uncharacterized protein n=1 Tax=Penicillium taxi TaxID=168475 RepID=UPI002544E0E1|nr:uncharacterized protein N7495_003045 [Penicillium taxi]KAJ5902517.1 hypothetical protein N7495_003045 [Penicillium taxi]